MPVRPGTRGRRGSPWTSGRERRPERGPRPGVPASRRRWCGATPRRSRAALPLRRTRQARRIRRARRARPVRSAGRSGPVGGAVARRPALRPRAVAARRPAQRRRSLPLLAPGGGGRRSGHPPARLPRRGGELAARPEHRLGRTHRQRVPRPRGPCGGPAALEPSRCDGDRSIPARTAPPRRRRAGGVGRGARPAAARRGQPARRRRAGDLRPAPGVRAAVRAGGPGPVRGRPAGVHRRTLHRAVRLNAVGQRGRGRGGGDARVGTPAPLRPAPRRRAGPVGSEPGPPGRQRSRPPATGGRGSARCPRAG